jgi:potassium efflux system protein
MFLIIIEKVLLKVTSKTKTQADDILIKKSSKPLSLIIILLGLRLAIEELSLDSSIEEFMSKVIFSIIVLFVSYLAYLIMDIIIFRALKKMAKSNYESVKDLMSLAKSNGKLADSKIQNVALPEPRSRVVIPFGVAYGSNISKVKRIVKSELKKIKNLEKDSEIIVRFLEMSDSSLNFKAYFYVDSFEHRIDAVDEANTRIYESFNRNRIEIPFPQRDVHMKE